MNRRSLLRVLRVMNWSLFVAILVFLGVSFGWRWPVTLILACALLAMRMATQQREPGRLRTFVEFILFALIGMLLGVFVFGGAGGIFGFAIGITLRLAEMPTTGVFRSRPRDSNGPTSG
jgi:hypothetical protein